MVEIRVEVRPHQAQPQDQPQDQPQEAQLLGHIILAVISIWATLIQIDVIAHLMPQVNSALANVLAVKRKRLLLGVLLYSINKP